LLTTESAAEQLMLVSAYFSGQGGLLARAA
jgi:hypothetical protein